MHLWSQKKYSCTHGLQKNVHFIQGTDGDWLLSRYGCWSLLWSDADSSCIEDCMDGCMGSYMEGCMINPILLSISSQSSPPIKSFSILSPWMPLLMQSHHSSAISPPPSETLILSKMLMWDLCETGQWKTHVKLIWNYMSKMLMWSSYETDLSSNSEQSAHVNLICKMGLLNGNIMSNWSETPMCEQNAHVRLMWNWSA